MALQVARKPGSLRAAIDVTPMADIMIVLLVIFMVATPFLGKDDRYRLPAAAHAADRKEAPLVVRVTRTGAVWVGSEAVPVERLADLLPGRIRDAPLAVQFEADETLGYDVAAPVLRALRVAGAGEIVLRTQPSSRSTRKP